jgi:aminoglycoside phosphotransferase family enzyme
MEKEITIDTITKEEIVEMAQYIQQLEQLSKDQRGYILQLQQQLTNAGKKLAEFHKQASNIVRQPIVETATLELPTLKRK